MVVTRPLCPWSVAWTPRFDDESQSAMNLPAPKKSKPDEVQAAQEEERFAPTEIYCGVILILLFC